MKRFLVLLTALLLWAAIAQAEITEAAQLNAPGMTVGVSQGSIAEITVRELLPLANVAHYTDRFLGFTALAQGKIDAFVYDRVQMQLTIQNGQTGVHLLEETLGDPVRIAVGLSPVSRIPDLEKKVNRFIAEIRADGILDDMYRRWVMEGNRTMPEIPVPESSAVHLTVGTAGIVPPYSYYESDSLNGYDIELAHRFAAWLGADLSFQVYDFAGLVAAAQSGKVDVIMSNLQYTPERAEQLPFSDTLFEEMQGIMVRGEAKKEAVPAWQAYNGKIIGVQTGASFDKAVAELLPEAQLAYYNGKADLVAALTGNKVDAFVVDEPVAQILMREDDRLASLPDYLEKYEFAFVFPKNEAGEALRKQYNAFLEKLGKEKLEALEQKWFGEDENAKTMPDPASLPAPNGTLRLATESGYAPFEYVRDGQVVGYDMEIAALFCEDSGYGLEIVDMNFDAVLPAVQTGKCDFAAAGISFTPERAESVSFSDPNYTGGTVLVTLKTQAAAFQEETPTEKKPEGSFWSSLSSSFEKTFLRESRWKLFLEGIGTTLLITVLSILFGTALGFLVFMLCRNGNPLANKITGFSVWLVSGTPMVVLMMILYYLVFGSVAISGITVAVIGFTLTFGAAVLGLLRMGVGTVDRGQYEAAYALGHSSRHTFFRIILPQAIPHVLPAYQAEIVGLIKSTAIVGYIAVQDLTKMGDIVRSRTYEAFFPLIAITVIYFLLEGLFSIAVSRIRISIDPKKRKREKILKGVNVHDQD